MTVRQQITFVREDGPERCDWSECKKECLLQFEDPDTREEGGREGD